MNRLLVLSLLAPAIALAAGCTNSKATAGARPAIKAPAVQVDTVVVEERAMPRTVLLAGSLKANQESDVAANATGRVLRTMVERGSFVSREQAVAQLDARFSTLLASESKANLETARTQRDLAQQDCARFQNLHERGAISQQDFDKVMAGCKTSTQSAQAAEARAQQALQTLGDSTVRAPFAGLVAERFVSAGEFVRPDTKVVHVVDIDSLRLELTISEGDMGAVKVGQSVGFQVTAFPGRTFTGVVRYIGPAVRAATRDLVFEAVVPNRDRLLRPGLFATAQLDVGLQKLRVVPGAALRKDGETVRAFVVVDKHLEERVVQPGPTDGDRVAVLTGLAVGERIVARPTDKTVDGLEVE